MHSGPLSLLISYPHYPLIAKESRCLSLRIYIHFLQALNNQDVLFIGQRQIELKLSFITLTICR